ncbi:MAG: YicC/YloC family endoribonuclease [Bacteroidales bacterium]
MIQSMTGFGKATAELPNRKITVEIKSLNSKQLDLSARICSQYREKEMEFRNRISQRLERGKVDFSVYVETVGTESSTKINLPVIENYFNQIKETSERLGVALPSDWFQILLRMPEAYKTEIQEIDPAEMEKVEAVVNMAIDRLCDFRKQEGEMLYKLFEQKISNIAQLLTQVTPYEKERTEKIKARITDALSKIEGFDYDQNRFEQEMIFYIEKLDINEEKHRLDNHLKYFIETMNNGQGQGKKLGFICQEIGREINTLGSKSNHAELQKIVVKMKDELEQIKEQVLNVL